MVFTDCTYKIVLPQLKNYKFLVILNYKKNSNKLLLYLYALINHENKKILKNNSIFKNLKIYFIINI